MSNLDEKEEFWCQWLKKYKSFQGIWDKQSKLFLNKSYKQEAWSELIKMAEEVNVEADLNYLRTRLSYFIYIYKQEEVKIKIAKLNGINYEPSSYFKAFIIKIFRSIYNQDQKENQLSPNMDLNLSNNEIERANQLFWRKVLKSYLSSKCLWDENKKAYTNEERKKSWLKLTKLVQTQHPKADIRYVKGRINSCRCVYLREIKKLEEAKKKGNEYKSTIYYFDILKQLYQKKYSASEQNDVSTDNNWEEDTEFEDSSEELIYTNYTATLTGDRKLWRKVLKKYVSFKCLWDQENRGLYSNGQRIAAWNELLDIVKKLNDKADLPYLKSRINNCRSIHARELRKIASATKEKGIKFKSKLFYCDILCAMNQTDDVLPNFSSDESDNDEVVTFSKETSESVEKELKEHGYFYAPLHIIPQDSCRQIWLELITKYVAYKCLWDTKNRDNYKDYERDYAWQQLLYIARKERIDADLAYVRYRVRNMRTSYVRQFKRAQELRERGKDFEITLFYFNALSPIYQKGFPVFYYDESKGIYTKESSITYDYALNPANSTYFPEDEEDENKNIQINNEEGEEQFDAALELALNPTNSNYFPEDEDDIKVFQMDDEEEEEQIDTVSEFSNVELKNDDTEFEEENLNNFKTTLSMQDEEVAIKEEDMEFEEIYEMPAPKLKNTSSINSTAFKTSRKFDTFAKRIALHLESMESHQYLFAEKLISDVCISGRQSELTKQSRLVIKKL